MESFIVPKIEKACARDLLFALKQRKLRPIRARIYVNSTTEVLDVQGETDTVVAGMEITKYTLFCVYTDKKKYYTTVYVRCDSGKNSSEDATFYRDSLNEYLVEQDAITAYDAEMGKFDGSAYGIAVDAHSFTDIISFISEEEKEKRSELSMKHAEESSKNRKTFDSGEWMTVGRKNRPIPTRN